MARTLYTSGVKPCEILVSDEDYEALVRYNWFLTGNGYAYRWLPRNGERRRSVLMHREVMQAPDGVEVDHLNLKRLDNRRENLQLVGRSLNQHRATRKSCSGLRGVRFDKRRSKWQARIHFDGHELHLGSFDTSEQAASAYDAKARELYGATARVNSEVT